MENLEKRDHSGGLVTDRKILKWNQMAHTGTTPLWCMVTQLKGSADSWCSA
jgi:hypothetical protein